MYGLIGKMNAVAGKRDELAQILLAGIGEMPGNLSYVVANDPKDADGLWITEVWASEADHKASLGLPCGQSGDCEGTASDCRLRCVLRYRAFGRARVGSK